MEKKVRKDLSLLMILVVVMSIVNLITIQAYAAGYLDGGDHLTTGVVNVEKDLGSQNSDVEKTTNTDVVSGVGKVVKKTSSSSSSHSSSSSSSSDDSSDSTQDTSDLTQDDSSQDSTSDDSSDNTDVGNNDGPPAESLEGKDIGFHIGSGLG